MILKKKSFLGERVLIKNESCSATVQIISNKMTCLTVDTEAELMHRKIDEDYNGIIHNQQQIQENIINDNKKIKFNDLTIIAILGRGSFGS